MNTNEVINICKQLSSEGKQPTVALVKTRMAGPKVLPVIINGIKQFMANPNTVLEEAPTCKDNIKSDSQRISILESQVTDLIAQVDELRCFIESSSKK